MVLGIIPARYASTRFPGKPLVEIQGKPMIQHVYEQAGKARSLDKVIVATDDQRICDAVKSFGGNVVMTAETHRSGTDRCAEVAAGLAEASIVINIQGDEPYIDPAQIDTARECFSDDSVLIASLYKRIATMDELLNPSCPKVVMNRNGEALYFSRSPIPYLRGTDQEHWLKKRAYYKHVGIYGYRRGTLLELTALPSSDLEITESLEQLRWMEHGYPIKMAETQAETFAIDTPEDLKKLQNLKFRV